MKKQKHSSSSPDKNNKKEDLHRDREEQESYPSQSDEDTLDQTIEDSFPASDPPSSIPNPDEDAA